MLAPGTGRTQTARLWTHARDERPWSGEPAPAAWYRFSTDRKGQPPRDPLAGYAGWMHADGYAGFEDLYRSGAIQEVAGLAHVRRKFVDAHRSQASPIAEEAIRRIAQLDAITAEARGSPPERRAAIRQARAKLIFETLETWLAAQLPAISGRSPLATAIRYALARTERLKPPLEHGILEIENNAAERSRRAIALGRKNYLFVGSQAGRKAPVIAYTPIETAKLNGVGPQAWLGLYPGAPPRPQDHQDRRSAAQAPAGIAVTPDACAGTAASRVPPFGMAGVSSPPCCSPSGP